MKCEQRIISCCSFLANVRFERVFCTRFLFVLLLEVALTGTYIGFYWGIFVSSFKFRLFHSATGLLVSIHFLRDPLFLRSLPICIDHFLVYGQTKPHTILKETSTHSARTFIIRLPVLESFGLLGWLPYSTERVATTKRFPIILVFYCALRCITMYAASICDRSCLKRIKKMEKLRKLVNDKWNKNDLTD